ncbi:hypothetical protein AnigIFM59636_007718 [Aspergillus niger]|uniref:Contig An16c0080, genomic contig n=2 Tax=Aspergillus niger TaxID=5061 RepID=A2R719_ASPNC|nr:uncharacterized protein An16g01980 [Aspergillus niger]GKZ94346.1 hypothetical protein AnigIFM59636_007718 [Aspergillus niger]CAL00422.1 unnamed protein product [Aspergillus niger]SPB49687.1 unnamed protein product [Aspergillus niger]
MPHPTQPDIQYFPDYEKYTSRTQRRQATEDLPTTLPVGFPTELKSSLVWHGKDINNSTDWIFHLNEAQLDEINTALKSFQSLNLPLGHINQVTFPLPNLKTHLRSLSKDLHTGRGFFILRGLNVDRYTREENIIIYCGVSAYVANLRGRQQDPHFTNGKSLVISHIKDLTRTKDAADVGAPSNTADKQVFHTDGGDIISLICLNPSVQGGESYIASSWLIYNILARERPDLIHTLSEDWPFDGFGNKTRPYTLRPLLFHQPATASTPDRVIMQYARRYFTGFQAQPRSPDIPPITEAQAEALDALHFLAEENSATLDFQKGDIQYINNHSIFHARNGFVDEPGNEYVYFLFPSLTAWLGSFAKMYRECRRHLIRLWLRDEEYGWETPEMLRPRWEHVYKDVREEDQVFPLEPNVHKSLGS